MRVKAYDGNYWNELADHLAKEAACSSEGDIAHIKIPKSAVINELKGKKSCTSVAKRIGRLNRGRIKNFLAYCKRQNIQKTANVHKLINDCNWTWKTEVILSQIEDYGLAFPKLWSADHRWSSGSAPTVLLD
jgi:hypothetical protein